ncbi:MAG TPA: hypothetical protein EYG85_01105 [Crocinitomix sp.]|nr:hypothetical protein [Crocinitomix sp.]
MKTNFIVSTLIVLVLSLNINAQTYYKKKWAKVDSLENKGLYNMALTEVNKIFDDAIKKKRHNQVIKSVFYELKYNSYLKEDDYVLGIYKLENLTKDAPSPSKEILHSLTAEVYWWYYNANSWKFTQRTQIESKVKLNDIRTWDLKRIAKKVIYHYKKSIENTGVSQTIPLKKFNEIIVNTSDTKDYIPTLYDFLAHRVIDFFSSNTFNVPGPATTFTLNHSEYFSTNTKFLNLKTSTNDSLNTRFYAVMAYKLLTDFHLRHQHQSALLMLEFKRLKFAKNNVVLPNKNDLYLKALERMTKVYPNNKYISEVWYAIAQIYNEIGNKYITPDEQYRWEKKKALLICKRTIKNFPGSFGAKQCKGLINQIQKKAYDLSVENVFQPNQNNLVKINYKNIDNAYVKIIKIDKLEAFKKLRKQHQKIAFINKSNAVFSKNIDLINEGDYQNHHFEFILPSLDKGLYLIASTTQAPFSNSKPLVYTLVTVTNLTYQILNKEDEAQILVTDRISGEPVEQAKVSIKYKEYNRKTGKYIEKILGIFTTDKDGIVNVKHSLDNRYYLKYYCKIEKDEDVYNEGAFYLNKSYGNSPKTKVTTSFFTDRKIYRPGQTIYFKGIVKESTGNKHSLKKNYKTTVYFYDVNRQEIAKVDVETNEFGSFSGQFIAPIGVLTGSMSIMCKTGSTYFRVEEYKRPKFSTYFKPISKEYQVNDSVTVTGIAKAFAGNFIDGAEVSYRISRTTKQNRWYRGWWWRPTNTEKEIDFGTVTTNEKGEYNITFKAIQDQTKDPKTLPVFIYTIYADVTDINGETHSTIIKVSVGYHSLLLANNLQNEISNQQKSNIFRVLTTNLNNQPVFAKGNLKIHKLKTPKRSYRERLWRPAEYNNFTESEFRQKLPFDAYQNENNYRTWEKEQLVFEQSFNTSITDSILLLDFNKWKTGYYVYEATAKDKNGIEVKDIKYFLVYNDNAKKPSTNEVFKLKPLNVSVQPGEKAKFLLSTAEKSLSVFMSIEHKGKIEKQEWITLSNEQKMIEIPVEEKHRGNFSVSFSAMKHNRSYVSNQTIKVPYKNKQLNLVFSTFRNKLLPGQAEEWILTIKNAEGNPEMAELLATLYDASLDELYTPNNFYMAIYQIYNRTLRWSSFKGMGAKNVKNTNYSWDRKTVSYPRRTYPKFNYYGYSTYYYGRVFERYDNKVNVESLIMEESSVAVKTKSEDVKTAQNGMDAKTELDLKDKDSDEESNQQPQPTNSSPLTQIKARSNFNETAFFYPQLLTDSEGNIKIKFTIPESLTKWRFLGLAHTQDLKIGTITEEVITQKDLMVQPNVPRFLREGDKITLSSKIVNVSKKDLQGKVLLQLIDPFTEEVIDTKFNLTNNEQNFDVKASRSTSVSWTFDVPYQLSTVKYKIVAQAGNFSDGEENVLPILTNRMLVTESLPLPIRGKENKTFRFVKLINENNNSTTLVHHRYTLEFTSNPAWYAVQAMPYMMEYPYECSEQVFTRYYSNTIASHIMNSNPKIKQVIEDWGKNSPEAFLSNLQKNQELKSLLLEETPWVLNAKSEEETKKNLSILLDMNRMSKELDKALSIIIKRQSPNGGWPWFSGMKESRYITQHIITGMGHLDHLGIKEVRENKQTWQMIKKGVKFLDNELVKDFQYIKKRDKDYLKHFYLSYTQIQYMYMRSYFPKIRMDKQTQQALAFFKNQAKQNWLKFNIYAEGMIALAAHRFEMKELATDIVKSLKDRAIYSDEFGMYWKGFNVGYYWYQAPIETHALMIEMFDEVANDEKSVEELKIWLLKQKQTTHWKTTKQTTASVYALLLKGTDLLANDEFVQITIGNKKIKYVNKTSDDPYKVNTQAGTGYFKTAWEGDKVKPEMGKITVSKTTKGVAWGAVYWQYFEDLDKITYHETPLKLNKELYLLKHTPKGETLTQITHDNTLKVGDKIRVRIELRTDRNLEYVHMKDMRASAFEPINVLSSYKWREGLGYYEATKDASTNFFFDYIPKGTYVFEYDLRVQHKGYFSNGITTIQCMYAPEFTSHSEGIRVKVE